MSIGIIELVNKKKTYVKYATLGGGKTELPYDPILENNSWETINKYSRAGKAKDLWRVGDVKDGYIIIGFDHDDLADGTGKAGITFAVNDYNKSNSGEWDTGDGSSFIRYDLSTAYANLENTYNELTEINPYIKPITKKIKKSDTESTYISCTCKLFLFSASEMLKTVPSIGEYPDGIKNEGDYYDGFPVAFENSTAYYWTRSAIYNMAFIRKHVVGYMSGSNLLTTYGDTKYKYRYGFCI